MLKKFFNSVKRFFKKSVSFWQSNWQGFGWQWTKTQYLESYKRSLYVHAATKKTSQKVGTIEMSLFQIKNSNGEVQQVKNHPALKLMYRPNPFQTKAEFFQELDLYKLLSGNSFTAKIRDGRGNVIELWNLRPDRMTIYPGNEFISHYEYLRDDGTKIVLPPEDVIHIKDPSPLDIYFGLSVLQPASKRVDIESAANTYQRDFFKNNARPDSVLVADYELTKEQKDEMKEQWENRHKGAGSSSKLGVLEQGLKYQQVSLSQREMDYIDSMKFTRDDILTAFGVPKPIVSITDDVNRANAETAMIIFLSETVNPEMKKIVEKFNQELIMPDFGDNLFLDYTDPTPENREQILKEYETGLKNDFLLINEVREREGLEPVSGGWSWYQPVGEVVGGELAGKKKGFIKKPKTVLLASVCESEKGDEGIFNLRQELKTKMEMKETFSRMLKEALGVEKKKRKETKIIPEEMREDYANMILKVMDAQVKEFEKRILLFEAGQAKRVLKAIKDELKTKAFEIETILNIKKENELLAKITGPLIEEFLKLAGEDAMEILKPADDYEQSPKATKFVKERKEFLAKSVNATTATKLETAVNKGLNAGEGVLKISERIKKVYSEFPDYRADMIARTEVTAANNSGLIDGYRQSGVADSKEWVAVLDARTRPEHVALDGEVVKLDEEFSNGLPYPQEVNCRCVIAPVIGD